MVDLEVFAGRGSQALAVGANAVFQLAVAGGVTEVRGRTAHVVDVAFEPGQGGDLLRFLHHALHTAGADGSSLMEGKRAKVTAAEAAAVMGQRELHLFNARHAARRRIGGVIGALIGQAVDVIQFLAFQRGHGRVLHQQFIVVAFADGAPVDGVLIPVLDAEGFGVGALIGFQQVVVKGCGNVVVDGIGGVAEIDRSAHVADFADRHAAVEQFRHTQKDVFAHAVGQQVCAAVHEDRAAHLVVPVVVMRKAAERGFQTAEDDGHVAVCLADAVGIDDDRAVGAFAHHAARGVIVEGTVLFGGGIMRDHAVDIPRGHKEAEARLAVLAECVAGAEVGLGEDCHAVACVLQHARNDGNAEGRVVDVSVARDVNEVGAIPTARVHIGAAEGQEGVLFIGIHRIPPREIPVRRKDRSRKYCLVASRRRCGGADRGAFVPSRPEDVSFPRVRCYRRRGRGT